MSEYENGTDLRRLMCEAIPEVTVALGDAEPSAYGDAALFRRFALAAVERGDLELCIKIFRFVARLTQPGSASTYATNAMRGTFLSDWQEHREAVLGVFARIPPGMRRDVRCPVEQPQSWFLTRTMSEYDLSAEVTTLKRSTTARITRSTKHRTLGHDIVIAIKPSSEDSDERPIFENLLPNDHALPLEYVEGMCDQAFSVLSEMAKQGHVYRSLKISLLRCLYIPVEFSPFIGKKMVGEAMKTAIIEAT